MLKVVSSLLVIAVAVAGLLAGSVVAASNPAPGAGVKAPKCIKWQKKHGKRVCVKHAKPKPKPTGGTTTTTTPTTPASPPDGVYAANTSQNTRLQFSVDGAFVTGFTINEVDATCLPGSWLYGVHLGFNSLSAALDDNGGFKASTPITFTDGSTGTFTLNGTISLSGTASGTLTWSHNYSPGGTASSCASGTVTWSGGTGASAPAPPVGPKLGHYTGTTTQNNHFAFDLIVNASGYLEATNVALDEMDESCTPQANLTVPAFYFGSFQFFVNAGGHMHAAFTADGESFILDATIDSTGHATGTAHDSNVVPYEGTTYSCDSGPVSWTATLG